MAAIPEVTPLESPQVSRSLKKTQPQTAQATDPFPAGASAKLETRSLNAWFGKKHALKGISLKVLPNGVTAIIGPSGCGKSTLLRCLNRMHELVEGARMEGQVLLDGEDVYEEDPMLVRRRIGMVFQRANPFPTMTIYDNVAAGLRFGGVRERGAIDAAVE
ncbi:MAG TPA: ATP-binding cassette domain-containing protein, partial [Thermoplasmata archaeon]|nr:ATP-binding cassette domain-containing protein [Thermoplasmata archaeon]